MKYFTVCKATLVECNKQSFHRLASEDEVEFFNFFITPNGNGKLSVTQLIQNESSNSTIRNRHNLYSIARAINICGKQNILRTYPGTGTNCGNFLVILVIMFWHIIWTLVHNP